MEGRLVSKGLEVLDVEEESLPEGRDVGIVDVVFLTDLLHDGGNGGVVILRYTREEMVLNLVVEGTAEESSHSIVVSIVDSGTNLVGGPVVLERRLVD